MAYAPKVVLQLPLSSPDVLPEFVKACVQDKVALIAVWGAGCEEAEDLLDELIVNTTEDPARFITTTAHEDETLEDVIAFADGFLPEGRAQLVSL